MPLGNEPFDLGNDPLSGSGQSGSLSYHEFADPDTDAGKVLNRSKIVTLRQSETAHGFCWIVPDDWTGGSVSVSATAADNDAMQPAALADLPGYVDPSNGHRICLDFAPGLVKPCGDWAFYATMTLGGEIDVTSAILARILPDLT